MISAAQYHSQDSFKDIVKQYLAHDCLIDTHYRKFYYYYDQHSENTSFEELRDLVENIYVNEYLSEVIPKWNAALVKEDVLTVLALQRNFYNQHVLYSKDRVVVIISDALRYEVGRSRVLPSSTKYGMAALLPHQTLAVT